MFSLFLFVLLSLFVVKGQWTHLPKPPYIKVKNKDLHGNVVSVKNLLVSYEHKILFCPIQKSASTLWTQFMCRLYGDPHWYEPSWHKLLPTIRGKSREHIEEILNDPNWTKAIFLRDPTRRLLSSYRYCINKKGENKFYLDHMAKVTKSNNISWAHFYRSVADPKIRLQNLHWRPQGDFCGFKKFYPLYQFVGNMERMSEHGRELLNKLGLWEKYGANEWSLAKVIKTSKIRDNSKNRYKFKKPENYNKSDCMFCNNNSPHKTSYHINDISEKKNSRKNVRHRGIANISHTVNTSADVSLTHFLTRDIWQHLRDSDFYAEDYDLFQKILVGPFNKSLYLHYPPPSSKIS